MQIQIDPERLHSLRQKKGLSRPQLAKQSGITERTIQRLEKEPQPSQKKHSEPPSQGTPRRTGGAYWRVAASRV